MVAVVRSPKSPVGKVGYPGINTVIVVVEAVDATTPSPTKFNVDVAVFKVTPSS